MVNRLVLISPCRNEADFIETTIKCVVSQSRPPDRWIIVDDGSTDGSPDIVRGYCDRYGWIELVHRERNGPRETGLGGVAAFNYGVGRLGGDPYDVIANLDCDLQFGPETFASILRHFDDGRVGMAGGKISDQIGERLVPIRYADYHLPGAVKFYRRECFEAIGGPKNLFAWDILDETDARRYGWVTLSDPDIPIIHHRVQGTEVGTLRGRVAWGQGAYAVGSHPLFVIARGFYRMLERPWIVGGLALIWGFFSSYFNRAIARNPDKELIRFLRGEQLYRLTHGNRLPPREDGQ